MKKGTQLLEVYALEIQMHTDLKNTKKLKELYKMALDVKSAIPHPRIMGIIRECGGKMHMHERVWSDAATDFFEVRNRDAPQDASISHVSDRMPPCLRQAVNRSPAWKGHLLESGVRSQYCSAIQCSVIISGGFVVRP